MHKTLLGITILCSFTFADKLYFLKISPDEVKNLSQREIVKIISSDKNAYDVNLNRDLMGEKIGKVVISKYAMEKYGRRSNVEDIVVMGSSNPNKMEFKSEYDKLIYHLAAAAKTADNIKDTDFDKDFVKKSIYSIIKGVNSYVMQKSKR